MGNFSQSYGKEFANQYNLGKLLLTLQIQGYSKYMYVLVYIQNTCMYWYTFKIHVCTGIHSKLLAGTFGNDVLYATTTIHYKQCHIG